MPNHPHTRPLLISLPRPTPNPLRPIQILPKRSQLHLPPLTPIPPQRQPQPLPPSLQLLRPPRPLHNIKDRLNTLPHVSQHPLEPLHPLSPLHSLHAIQRRLRSRSLVIIR